MHAPGPLAKLEAPDDMQSLIERLDWSASPIGAPAGWPPALRTAMGLIRPAGAQIVLFWGPDYVALYNDAFAPTIGDKHPRALGRPARENWAELWDDLEPLLRSVRETGETVQAKDRPFYIERHGYGETVYFDISYSPVPEADGSVGGVLCIVSETTERVLAEQRVEGERERFARIFEQAAAGLARTDADGRFQEVNDRYCEIVGRSREELMSLRMQDLTHPDDLPGNLIPLARLIKSGEPFEIEKRYLRPDGTVVWVRNSVSAVRAPGQPLSILAVSTDITDRHDAEEALRQSESRLRLVQAAARIGMFSYDAGSAGAFCSPEYLALYGLPADTPDFDANAWLGCVHPDDREQIEAETRAAVQDPTRSNLEQEFRIIRADTGETRWIASRTELRRDAAGTFVRSLGAQWDITARRQAEAARQDSERELQLLADTLPVLISYMDAERRYRFVNQAYERWFPGRNRAELVGLPVREVLGEAGYEVARPWMDRVLAGETVSYEADMPYPQGSKHIRVNYVPRLQGDKVVGFYGLISDISDTKRAELALRESEERFRNMADHAPVMMWVTDASGACTYLNRAWYEFTGQTVEEAEGFGWLDATHPDDMERTEREFLAANAAHVPFRVEYRLRRADGAYRWAIDAASPRFGPDGTFLGFIGSVIDIDDRHEAERAIEESEERLRLAAEAADLGYWDVDVVNDVLIWPPRVKAMFGISPDVPVSMADFFNGLHPDDRAATAEAYAAACDPAERALYDVDYRTVGKEDGVIRWVSAKGRGVFDASGRCVRVMGTALDITERKAADLALRESLERLRFLGELDEALRNTLDPVTAMAAATRLLSERLHVTRSAYADVDDDNDRFFIRADHSAPGVESSVGEYRLDLFGPRAAADMRTGRTLIVRDVPAELAPGEGREMFQSIGIDAIICCPLVRDGRLKAMMAVHNADARDWTPDEIALVETVVERCWAHVERVGAQARLRESESKFHAIANSIDQMVWSTRPDGFHDYFNDRWYEFTGVPYGSTDGEAWNGVFHPDDQGRSKATWQHSLATGEPYHIEYRLRHRSGQYRWVIGRAQCARDETGRIVRWYGTCTDIHDLKSAEERLRDSEERYRTLFESIESGFCVVEVDLDGPLIDYRVVEANPAFYRQTGFPADIGGRWLREAAPDLEDDWYEIYGRVARTGASERFEQGSLALGRWFDVYAFRVGAPDERRVAILFTDISARRNAEERLREESRTLETLNTTGAALAAELDLERVVQMVTDAGVELTGAAFGAFFYNVLDDAGESYMLYTLSGVDRSAFENFPMPRATAIFQPTFQGDGVVRSDDILADHRYGKSDPHFGMPKGHLPVRSYLAVPVTSRSGEVIGGLFFGHPGTGRFDERHENLMVGLAGQASIAMDNARLYQDVRRANETLEQRVLERTAELETAHEALRQSQKMEAMGQLTGGVAHDFNNLLTPIVGALDLLQRKGLGTDREQRLIGGAAQSADRAKTLVQRLLAFARRQPLRMVPVDVPQLVEGMADLIASTTGPQIKVAVEVDGALPPAKADPNQLEMALLNLAVNARDAMPDGGTLRISAGAAKAGPDTVTGLAPGNYVRLSVADTGTGMNEDTLKRAIEPFFSTKGIGRGTGLGLSMVHGLALQLGGALNITSKVGLGTNIELWLPESRDRPAEAADTPAERDMETRRGTVLLVDDEELVRLSTADMLEDMGYHVIEASSAETAIAIAEGDKRFDLLVTDHLMPGMSGAELARRLRAGRPDLPVLVVSGYAESDGLAPDLPRLTKPFRKDELAASLAAITDG